MFVKLGSCVATETKEKCYPLRCSVLVLLNYRHSDPMKHADKPSSSI